MTNSDGKNLSLAAFSSLYTFATAIETQTLITITSAIVLPILFFAVGKAADLCVQLYFRRKEEKRNATNNPRSDQ